MSNNTYRIEYASSGRSSCKHTKCKKPIEKLHLRIGKLYPSDRFETDGQAIDWFHPNCFFEKQKKARKTTKKVDEIDDLEGFDDIKKSDQKYIQELIQDHIDTILSKPKSKSKSKAKSSPVKSKTAASSWFVDDSGNVTNSDDEDNHSKSTNNNSNISSSNKKQKPTFKPSEDDLFDEEDLMDKYDASKSLQSNIQSAKTTSTATTATKKPFKLSSILSNKWYSSLEPVLTKNKALFDEIVGEKRNVNYNLPISTQIFSSLNYVGSPKDCKVIFFGASPNYKKETSCGFSFCDASADKWTLNNVNSATKNLIRAALINRGYITKDDTLDSIQEALKEIDLPSDNPRDWFKSTAKQGVLWLNASLTTSIENEDNKVPSKIENYWKPVVSEIIRTIFQSKIEEDDPSPTIVVLLGKQLLQLRNEVELIHSEFMGAVPVEFIEGTSPFLELFLNENYFKKINNYLESHKSTPIDWWKPKDDEDDEDEEEEEDVEEDNSVGKDSGNNNVPEKVETNKSNNSKYSDIFDQEEEGPKDIDMEESNNKSSVKNKPNSQPSNDFLDNENNGNKDEEQVKPVCNLIQENGEKIQLKYDEPFTLGRNILEIKDKLVSRNQAIVKFTKSLSGKYCVELIPKGQNPVHIDKDGTLEPLDVGLPIYLNNKQQFLLCSQKYPFTVEIISKSITPKKQPVKQQHSSQQQQQQSQQVNKRKYDDFEEEGSSHSSVYSSSSSNKQTPNKKVAKTSPEKPKAKPKAKPKKKNDDFIDFDEEEVEDSDDDYVPPSDDDENEFAGLKPFVKTRSQDIPDCQYWDQCYRKNPQHFKEFRHPHPYRG